MTFCFELGSKGLSKTSKQVHGSIMKLWNSVTLTDIHFLLK